MTLYCPIHVNNGKGKIKIDESYNALLSYHQMKGYIIGNRSHVYSGYDSFFSRLNKLGIIQMGIRHFRKIGQVEMLEYP